jgi:hyaluronoglucosaminidase
MAPLAGGERVWLAIPEKNLVVAVDTRTCAVSTHHDVHATPCGVTPARDQRTLLVVTRNPPAVSRLDPVTGHLNSSCPIAPGPIAVAAHPQKDTAFALVAGGVQSLDLTSGSSSAPIPVGLVPSGFAIARAGKTAYVTSSDANSVSVIDIDRRSIRDTWNTGNHPTAIVYVP